MAPRPTIFMSAVERKDATTTDKLAPPSLSPAALSKNYSQGHGFKGPGQADKTGTQRWEVATCASVPGFATLRQGDTIKLTVFVVHGDEHEVRVTDPTGRDVVAETTWSRGREYQVSGGPSNPAPITWRAQLTRPGTGATILALPWK